MYADLSQKHFSQADGQFQDTSCIATLTPVITDQFHALNDIEWYLVA
jgi:hypothetical protein